MSILRPGVQTRFESTLTVIEGGSGFVRGLMVEPPQGAPPAQVFTLPRMLLRTQTTTALKPGMVIRSQSGSVFIVGDNGASEYGDQTLFYSWRLFQATGMVMHSRQTTITEPITGLEQDVGVQNLGLIWAVIEPVDREVLDRRTHIQFETRRFVTGQPVLSGDILDGKTVNRCDLEQGVYVGVIT